MTAPVGALAEAEKAALAFQAALIQIGVATIYEAIRLWGRVPANKAAETAGDWLEDAVRLVMSRRGQSRDLALAYYRLARALRTGTTIPDPYDPIPTVVRLADLRSEFARLVADVTGKAPDFGTDDDDIPVEEIDGIDTGGDEEEARLEKQAEKEARIVLEALGPKTLKKRVDAIDTTRPADEVDGLRDEAHSKAGSRQAAAADRIAMNGGRGTVYSLAERDKRVLGYVRVHDPSRSDTPCGWCAMLISRGFVGKNKGVLYDSEFAAERKTQSAATVKAGTAQVGDEYHDLCHCIAEPVYNTADLESPRFDINRRYGELWPQVTRGKSGKAAMTEWRRYFRRLKKQGDANPGNAQAA